MAEHCKLIETDTRTEFVEIENGNKALIFEEKPQEMKCRVIGSYSENNQSYDVDCEIGCESLEEMKRCRKQMVLSFASDYSIPGFSCGFIGEDEVDIFRLMVCGTGFYSHFSINEMSRHQLSGLANQILDFKKRCFPAANTINGRILIHGGLQNGWEDIEPLFYMFIQTCSIKEANVQFYFNEDVPLRFIDIDIWLYPAKDNNE